MLKSQTHLFVTVRADRPPKNSKILKLRLGGSHIPRDHCVGPSCPTRFQRNAIIEPAKEKKKTKKIKLNYFFQVDQVKLISMEKLTKKKKKNVFFFKIKRKL